MIKSDQTPLVSVLMTSFNRERYIGEAIESVLSSTFKNFELIIVDDCSSDNTLSIAKSFARKDNRIRVYLNEENLGDYSNRNKASTYARGKYLKYVDSDDKIFNNTLDVMVKAMEQFPDVGFAVSSRSENSTTIFTPSQAYKTHFFVRGLLDYGPTGTIISKEKFVACGMFKTIRNVSDLDLWMRMGLKYPVIELPKDLVFWREHENQEIKLAPEYYLQYILPIIQEHLNNELCALTLDEKEKILDRYRRSTARALIKSLLRSRNVRASLKLWNSLSLSPFDVFK